jgi:cation diffusion facilitator family transporter
LNQTSLKTAKPDQLPATVRPALREAWFAMRLSLIVGVVMLAGKVTAWILTGSTAILADAAESVVHVVAVAFAAFSLRLSQKPAAPRFLYGYERIAFLSAGFEGAMIVLAAIYILITAIQRWLAGLQLENLGAGALLLLAAGCLNAALGWYLTRTGRRLNSLILEADGKHVLTDSWTSFGVVLGLALVIGTHWKPFDPIIALLVAVNILWSGGKLVWRAAVGLLDYSDPAIGHQIRQRLDSICTELGIKYHGVRFRATGYRQMVEVHLLFPRATELGDAHALATKVEETLATELTTPTEVITHMEALEDHESVHAHEHYTGLPM